MLHGRIPNPLSALERIYLFVNARLHVGAQLSRSVSIRGVSVWFSKPRKPKAIRLAENRLQDNNKRPAYYFCSRVDVFFLICLSSVCLSDWASVSFSVTWCSLHPVGSGLARSRVKNVYLQETGSAFTCARWLMLYLSLTSDFWLVFWLVILTVILSTKATLGNLSALPE